MACADGGEEKRSEAEVRALHERRKRRAAAICRLALQDQFVGGGR